MCARYVMATADLVNLFDVAETGDDLPGPAWNIKPTNRVPVVLESAKGSDAALRRLETARWSLTPPLLQGADDEVRDLQRQVRDGS